MGRGVRARSRGGRCFPVFPCRPGKKTPLVRGGFKAATTDAAQICAWWGEHATANVAIATKGLFVVDIDVLEDGSANGWLDEHPERRKDFDRAPTSRTPRGGQHFFFAQPHEAKIRISAGKLGRRVDVRADGGYVLVWPSVVDGKSYGFAERRGLDVPPSELPIAPSGLVDLATRKNPSPSERGLGGRRTKIPEGKRNDTLARIAGRMRAKGSEEREIAEELLSINSVCCDPPLPEDEVKSIAESIGNYPHGSAGRERAIRGGVTQVVVGTDEFRVTNEVVAAISGADNLYQRGGKRVRVTRPASTGAGSRLAIEEHSVPSIRELITERCELLREKDGVLIPMHPPAWVILQILARNRWNGVRVLQDVIDVPFFRNDGSLCTADGYDGASGILLEKIAEFSALSEEPTRERALNAAKQLADIVADFPFESRASLEGFLCALITRMCRTLFPGAAPIFLFDANCRAAGKTLLCDVIGTIALGSPCPVTTYSRNQEELRKAITSTLMAGHRMMLLDNLDGELG